MKIFVGAACAEMAAIQDRQQHALRELSNAKAVHRRHMAGVANSTVRPIDARHVGFIVDRWEVESQAAVAELREASPMFAYVLALHPAANDDKFNPGGLA